MTRTPEIDFWTNPKEGGLTYRRLWWRASAPKAVLCIHHGLGEHAGRYQTLADALEGLPIDIQAYDVRGHGESEGARGDAPGGLNGLVDDFEAIFPTMLERSNTTHAFVMGHSMGGAVVGQYATTRTPVHPSIRGYIFSSPAMMVPRTPIVQVKLLVGKVLGKAFPTLTLPSGIDVNNISSIPEEVERYRNDPLVHDKISAQLGVSLTSDGEEIPLRADRIKLPTLVYHGDGDHIVDIQGTRAFVQGLGTDEVTFEEMAGCQHELLHEAPFQRKRVFELIRTFIHANLPPEQKKPSSA